MPTVTVSDQGQVVIPAEIRRRLDITAGCQLEFSVEKNTLRVEVKRRIQPTRPEDGYGMLICQQPGKRRLSDFDLAWTIPEATDGGA